MLDPGGFRARRTDTGRRRRTWVDVTDVRGPLVSILQTFVFEVGGREPASDSTLRFCGRAEALSAKVPLVEEVCTAPDLPGLGFAFVALRAD